jgi:hypothetical protein
VRVFAPRRFSHQIYVHWQKREMSGWTSRDRIPLEISGGRGEGFRGVTAKAQYEPGRWRVDIETEDGRVLGGETFTIREDDASSPRYRERWM